MVDEDVYSAALLGDADVTSLPETHALNGGQRYRLGTDQNLPRVVWGGWEAGFDLQHSNLLSMLLSHRVSEKNATLRDAGLLAHIGTLGVQPPHRRL